jgi:hypothetical protein
MGKLFKFLSFIFLTAFATQIFALESSDVLNVSVLKAYNKNILVLNRGAEDGIFKKDHIKITSNDGFMARGICIKSTMLTSHWKIYRVVRPELLSKDIIYKMRSINQSGIPRDLHRYTKVSFARAYNQFGDKNVQKEVKLQQERIIKSDLPKTIKTARNYRESEKNAFDKIIETTFTEEDAIRDFSEVYIEVFANPIAIQTREDQKETHYGMSIKNYGRKYQFQINAVEKQISLADPISGATYESKSTHYDGQFQINRITKNFSLISEINFDRQKIGNTYYPHKHYQVGLLGLRYHIWEEDPRYRLIDISYLPTFDTLEYSEPNSNSLDERIGLRHRFQLRIFSKFTKRVSNKTILTYAPFQGQDSDSNEISSSLYTKFSTVFAYHLEDRVSVEYGVDYENDEFQGDLYNIRSDNTTQTFRFKYAWDL